MNEREIVAPIIEGTRSRYRYVILGMLLLVYTISYIDRQIIGILSMQIKADLHLSDGQLGLMGGFAFAIFYTGLGIPIARLADRANRVHIMGGALALWSLFTALCGMAGSFTTLLLARVGVGVGEAGGVAPAYSLLADYFPPRERGRVLGFYSLGVPLGSAAGLLIGGYVGAYLGWRQTFYILGLIGIVLAPVFLLVVRETQRGALDPKRESEGATSFGDVLAHLRHQPVFWIVSVGTGFGAMMSYGLAFWLPSFVQRSLHLDLTQTAQLLGIVTLIGGPISMVGSGWLADKFGTRNLPHYALIPCYGCLATLALLFIALNVASLALVIVVLFAVQIFSQAYAPPSIALIQSLAPAHMRATTSAIFLLILNAMGLGLGPVAFGFVSDGLTQSFGQEALRYAIVLCAVLFYLAAAVLFWRASLLLRAKAGG